MVYLEGFEEDGLESFLAGADDAVIGVVAETGHEDDGHGGISFVGGGEDIVAAFVGHFDVADDQVVVGLVEIGNGFGAVGGGGDHGVIFLQDVADGVADVGFVVGDEDGHAADDGVGFAFDVGGAEDGVGSFGGLSEGFSDDADVVENLLEAGAEIVVADVVVHEGAGVGGDVVEGAGGLGADIVGDFVTGADALDDHEIENVEGDGDVAAEDFGELAIVLVEGGAVAAFDVEDADDFVVEAEGDGKAAFGAFEAGDVAWVAFDVGADVASAGGGDVAADAVAFGFGEEIDAEGFLGRPALMTISSLLVLRSRRRMAK